jgi:hypothetical protein
MPRVDPTRVQRERLLRRNAHRCCVCKRDGVGLELHHIDGNPSRTIDDNLAVLCVEEHDRHHRPSAYSLPLRHLELDSHAIYNYKKRWESFVAAARQPEPAVFGTVTAYGTVACIHSIQLVMQWPNGDVEYSRAFHLLDGDVEWLAEQSVREAQSFGGRMFTIYQVDRPMPVDHCPCCGSGLLRTMSPGFSRRLQDPTWATESVCAIYVEPAEPALALIFALADEEIATIDLHLCVGRTLHYHNSSGYEERIEVTDTSVRERTNRTVRGILRDWAPARAYLGTGDGESPTVIEWTTPYGDLPLPRCWEQARKKPRRRHRPKHRD